MNPPDIPAGSKPDTSKERGGSPSSGEGRKPTPARERPDRPTPDKEGGAPVDELDLDGDGSRRQ